MKIKYIAIAALIGGALYYRKGTRPVGSVLFIGDSNTAAAFSYADQLNTLYPSVSMSKIAMVGAKTDWMLSRLKKALSAQRFDVIAILGGSNDIYARNEIATAKANLLAMYNLVRKSGAKLLAIAPPNKDFYTKKTPQKQELLKALIAWIEASTKNDLYINFWAMTADKKYFIPADGYLHAQAPAHTLLATKAATLLKL